MTSQRCPKSLDNSPCLVFVQPVIEPGRVIGVGIISS